METDRSIFLSIAELRRRYRTQPQPMVAGPLTEFELRCFSQHGEDGVIAEILARIGIGSGFFVEFGIETGREGNCVFLADVLGWEGVFIEPDEAAFSELARKYAQTERVRTMNAAVTPDNIENLFAAAGVPPEPDVLSIDVDGQDYWIWAALESYRPRVAVIEYNAVLPPGRQLVQPRGHREAWDGTDYFGASLDALCALADRKGYMLAHTDLAAVNAFFVRSELAAVAAPPPDEVARRHQPNYFMQGYRHPVDSQQRPYTDLTADKSSHPGSATLRRIDPVASPKPLTPALARELAARTDFVWHQRFELAEGVYSPGASDIEWLMSKAEIPRRLDGATVLDVGTTNGGAAFECERRGARRVVAVDIADENWFGFAALKKALGSSVEHVQASIYQLPELLAEQFDVVLFWGVLYHLRHPLLALDNVRRLACGTVSIETAVSDHELGDHRAVPLARFFRTDELAGDSSNWFAPNLAALTDWCRSCGLPPTRVVSWPEPLAARAIVITSTADPEWPALSYEQPLSCSVGPLTILSSGRPGTTS
jgi:SAM-dependent methyltransferase